VVLEVLKVMLFWRAVGKCAGVGGYCGFPVGRLANLRPFCTAM
jgi:hypothetical protein